MIESEFQKESSRIWTIIEPYGTALLIFLAHLAKFIIFGLLNFWLMYGMVYFTKDTLISQKQVIKKNSASISKT